MKSDRLQNRCKDGQRRTSVVQQHVAKKLAASSRSPLLSRSYSPRWCLTRIDSFSEHTCEVTEKVFTSCALVLTSNQYHGAWAVVRHVQHACWPTFNESIRLVTLNFGGLMALPMAKSHYIWLRTQETKKTQKSFHFFVQWFVGSFCLPWSACPALFVDFPAWAMLWTVLITASTTMPVQNDCKLSPGIDTHPTQWLNDLVLKLMSFWYENPKGTR